MHLYIKNMVCDRCKTAVKVNLEENGLHPASIQLVEVDIAEQELSVSQLDNLKQSLSALGFELIDDRKSKLIEKIKNVVIDRIHYNAEPNNQNFSDIIASELHYDYPYLSKLFSEIEGITIEHYIIEQKIEKVKELLVYDELSLSEIADKLGYSSIAHLSAQFKKNTGLPPSHFKRIGLSQRKPLDKVGKS